VEQVQLTLYVHPVGQKRKQIIILNKKFQQHVLENKEQTTCYKNNYSIVHFRV